MNDCETCLHLDKALLVEPCVNCENFELYEPINDVIKLWTDAGGTFDGLIGETATIPSDKLFDLLRKLTL